MAELDTLLSFKATAVGVWWLALFVAERVVVSAPWPPRYGRGSWHRVARNSGLWIVNAVSSRLLVVPWSALAAGLSAGLRPEWWSGPLGLALDLIILDAWIYFWHRANHVVPFLWRFHEIHHLDPFLDTTSATRFHIGEVLLSALVRVPVIIVLGVPLAHVIVFETLVLLAALFHHSNVALPPKLERALSWIIVTPSIHWMHHHAVRQDTDSNYATVLSLWDRLFGTVCANTRTSAMVIGVEGLTEPGFIALMSRPFLSAQNTASGARQQD